MFVNRQADGEVADLRSLLVDSLAQIVRTFDLHVKELAFNEVDWQRARLLCNVAS